MALWGKDKSNIPYEFMNMNLYSPMSHLQMTLTLSLRVKVGQHKIWFASNDFTDLESWLDRGNVGVSASPKNKRQI